MRVQQAIVKTLNASFGPEYLDVINESDRHHVPPGSESHFKVILVSPAFEGLNKVQRHQRVYQALDSLIESGIHALALHTYTPDEWAKRQAAPASPACMGGSKKKVGPV